MNKNLKKADEHHKIAQEYVNKITEAQKNHESASVIRFYLDTAEEHRVQGKKYLELAEKELIDGSKKAKQRLLTFIIFGNIFYSFLLIYKIYSDGWMMLFPYLTTIIWMNVTFLTIKKQFDSPK